MDLFVDDALNENQKQLIAPVLTPDFLEQCALSYMASIRIASDGQDRRVALLYQMGLAIQDIVHAAGQKTDYYSGAVMIMGFKLPDTTAKGLILKIPSELNGGYPFETCPLRLDI